MPVLGCIRGEERWKGVRGMKMEVGVLLLLEMRRRN